MKKGYRWSFTTLITSWMEVICVVMMLWVGVSWFEVICKNSKPNPDYWEYNALKIMVDAGLEMQYKN